MPSSVMSLSQAGLPDDTPLVIWNEGKVRHIQVRAKAVFGPRTQGLTACNMFWTDDKLRSADLPGDDRKPICAGCLRTFHARDQSWAS